VRLIKTGGAIAPWAAVVAKAMVLAPGIVAVNTLTGVEALGQLGFTVSSTAIGNALVVGVRTNSTTLTVTSLSGGGATWTLAASPHVIMSCYTSSAQIGKAAPPASPSTQKARSAHAASTAEHANRTL
jgi:hypothetical protein